MDPNCEGGRGIGTRDGPVHNRRAIRATGGKVALPGLGGCLLSDSGVLSPGGGLSGLARSGSVLHGGGHRGRCSEPPRRDIRRAYLCFQERRRYALLRCENGSGWRAMSPPERRWALRGEGDDERAAACRSIGATTQPAACASCRARDPESRHINHR